MFHFIFPTSFLAVSVHFVYSDSAAILASSACGNDTDDTVAIQNN